MECVICLQPQQNLHVCPTCTHAACAPCLADWAVRNPELNGVCTVCRRKSKHMRAHVSLSSRTRHWAHTKSRILCCALVLCFMALLCLSVCFPIRIPNACIHCNNITHC